MGREVVRLCPHCSGRLEASCAESRSWGGGHPGHTGCTMCAVWGSLGPHALNMMSLAWTEVYHGTSMHLSAVKCARNIATVCGLYNEDAWAVVCMLYREDQAGRQRLQLQADGVALLTSLRDRTALAPTEFREAAMAMPIAASAYQVAAALIRIPHAAQGILQREVRDLVEVFGAMKPWNYAPALPVFDVQQEVLATASPEQVRALQLGCMTANVPFGTPKSVEEYAAVPHTPATWLWCFAGALASNGELGLQRLGAIPSTVDRSAVVPLVNPAHISCPLAALEYMHVFPKSASGGAFLSDGLYLPFMSPEAAADCAVAVYSGSFNPGTALDIGAVVARLTAGRAYPETCRAVVLALLRRATTSSAIEGTDNLLPLVTWGALHDAVPELIDGAAMLLNVADACAQHPDALAYCVQHAAETMSALDMLDCLMGQRGTHGVLACRYANDPAWPDVQAALVNSGAWRALLAGRWKQVYLQRITQDAFSNDLRHSGHSVAVVLLEMAMRYPAVHEALAGMAGNADGDDYLHANLIVSAQRAARQEHVVSDAHFDDVHLDASEYMDPEPHQVVPQNLDEYAFTDASAYLDPESHQTVPSGVGAYLNAASYADYNSYGDAGAYLDDPGPYLDEYLDTGADDDVVEPAWGGQKRGRSAPQHAMSEETPLEYKRASRGPSPPPRGHKRGRQYSIFTETGVENRKMSRGYIRSYIRSR